MVLTTGEKVHVIIRRVFRDDLRRHFVGTVEVATDSVVRIEGFPYVYDTNSSVFVRQQYAQTRILNLISDLNIITVLPTSTILEKLEYRYTDKGRMILTDTESFSMDINEFGMKR